MSFFIITVFFLLCCNILKTKKSLHMLQQNLYNENNRYLKWIKKNYRKTVGVDVLAFFLSLIGLFVTYDLEKINHVLLIGMSFIYLLETVLLYRKMKKEKTKKPLVLTKRIERLLIPIIVLYGIPILFLFFFKNENVEWSFLWLSVLSFMTIVNWLVIFLANLINYPVERMVYHYYESKAKKKLASMNQLKIIGITGSYGKTSSKNILSDILNIRYIARPTPKNLNTYYGLMITINNHLDKFDDILIAEMGAYVRGDIKGLCDLVKPKYGILTTIGTAHLESFGSEENIIKGKFELIESLPKDGIGVLNRDDPKQVNYNLKTKAKLLWIGIEEEHVDVKAENIKANFKGSSFDVLFKGDQTRYHFETKLLGKHNVYNILASLVLGRELGISIEELIQAVRMVNPVEHRLELKRLGSFYQIDDAYNSNPVGAKSALEVLAMMPGEKIVVTPGMIELGEKEEELNRIFGEQIAEISNANYVILVGQKKTKPIYEGLKNKQFDMEKVIVTNDVREAYTIIQNLKTKDEIYALFENDLPDTYNEE